MRAMPEPDVLANEPSGSVAHTQPLGFAGLLAPWQRRQGLIGGVLWLVLALPFVRDLLQAQMWTHMMLQLPALAICGALMASAFAPDDHTPQHPWNAHGITGLSFCALVLTLSMVPRVLDMAVTDATWNASKFIGLTLCGMAWRVSWRPAAWVLQGFFLGNVLPMMAVVGYLYQDMPVRVCNAYGLQDQQRTGLLLNTFVVVVATAWLWRALRTLSAQDAQEVEPVLPSHGA
jgi:hypothetical protein